MICGSIGDSAAASVPATAGRSPAASRSSSTDTTAVGSITGAPTRSTTGAGRGCSVRSASRWPAASCGWITVGAQCTDPARFARARCPAGAGVTSISPR